MVFLFFRREIMDPSGFRPQDDRIKRQPRHGGRGDNVKVNSARGGVFVSLF
jgi:hypothetical protein